MTITQLRCFVEVAKELNYAKAAANLYISQPAVSRHVIALENDLGVTLFSRSRHNVALTSAGMRFFRKQKIYLKELICQRAAFLRIPEKRCSMLAVSVVARSKG